MSDKDRAPSWPPNFVNAPNFLIVQCLAEDDQFVDASIEIAHARRAMPRRWNTPIADGRIANRQQTGCGLLQRLTRGQLSVDVGT